MGDTRMKIGVVGSGYVFDHYMTTFDQHTGLEIVGVFDRNTARAQQVATFYGLHFYESLDALLADDDISIVANFTSIESHVEITKAALLAGKHVYSEKPMAMDLASAKMLVELAQAQNLRLSVAPSNALSATALTLWKAVEDGAVGDVRMVYAEFDDNPVYLLKPETWRSRSGAPWPYLHEYEMGCTWEHVGYHLTWMCAIFGPVRRVTAFSKATLPDKTNEKLKPPDTPDFSVACLDFQNGVVGRITCSIAAPTDHRMRVIGNRGVLSADTYRDYRCPVRLEPFDPVPLKARNLRVVRENTFLQWLTGVGGRRIPLAEMPPPGSTDVIRPAGNAFAKWKAAQRGWQDKSIGLAELADAIKTGRPHLPGPDFHLHLAELTLLIQGAGPDGACHTPTTSFERPALPERVRRAGPDYGALKPQPLVPWIRGLLKRA